MTPLRNVNYVERAEVLMPSVIKAYEGPRRWTRGTKEGLDCGPHLCLESQRRSVLAHVLIYKLHPVLHRLARLRETCVLTWLSPF